MDFSLFRSIAKHFISVRLMNKGIPSFTVVASPKNLFQDQTTESTKNVAKIQKIANKTH